MAVIRGYSTVATEAVCLSELLPWDLEAEMFARLYRWMSAMRTGMVKPRSV